MNELDQNIPTGDISDPPVTTDLLIKLPNGGKYHKPIKYEDDELYDEWVVTPKEGSNFEYPDAKLHKHISFLKSFVRIVGCVFGGFGMFIPAFVSFGIAELIGIVEEMV